MGGSFSSRTPAQHAAFTHACGPGGRNRLSRSDWGTVEAHFTEAELLHDTAPIALGSQPDKFGAHSVETHNRGGGIAVQAGGPRELGLLQQGPSCAVGGILDRDILEPEAQHGLEDHVVVPHPHLRELVDTVESVLDPRRLRTGRTADPHRRIGGRVRAVGESGAVDRILRRTQIGAGGRGGHGLDRIDLRLDRKGPHVTLEEGFAGRLVGLIDPPVVGLAEFKALRRSIGVGILGDGADRVGHVVEVLPEIYHVPFGRGRELSRCPAQDECPGPRRSGRLQASHRKPFPGRPVHSKSCFTSVTVSTRS